MQIFKTDKKNFLANELKSWLWTLAFATLLYFGFQQFLSVTHDKLIIGVVVLLLLKIGDTLTQYHVTEIQVDKQKNELTFLLNSIMSGEKVKKYELGQASSELIHNSGLTKLLSSPVTLKIFLTTKDTFRINNRYGFSTKTLTSVDNTLKSLSNSIATQ
jgi:hypothetical protein